MSITALATHQYFFFFFNNSHPSIQTLETPPVLLLGVLLLFISICWLRLGLVTIFSVFNQAKFLFLFIHIFFIKLNFHWNTKFTGAPIVSLVRSTPAMSPAYQVCLLRTTRNLDLGDVFFSYVFKFATINSILWRFWKTPLKSDPFATFFQKRRCNPKQ